MVKKRATRKTRRFPHKTYVITSAQGIQSPYSDKMYGRDKSKGRPLFHLIKNIQDYVDLRGGELIIGGVPGANVNEIELHPFFREKFPDNLWLEKDSITRNEQNKAKERAKRSKWEKRKKSWLEKKAGEAEEDSVPIIAEDFPYNQPMHYFWKDIPDTAYQRLDEKRLNEHLSLRGVPIRPQNRNPFSGKERLTKEHVGSSVIIPSPKKTIKAIPQGEGGEYPNLLMSTCACTEPNYNLGNLGFDAKEDHAYGAVVVDVLDDKIFLARIAPAHKNGTFIDLGMKCVPGKNPERANVVAMVVGDSHVADINPKVDRANRDMMKQLRPHHTHFNDVFAAQSLGFHNMDDMIYRAHAYEDGLTSLEKELETTAQYIIENAKLAGRWNGEIVINHSNHDDMLFRWLEKEGYRKDEENFFIGHQLIGKKVTRQNCFRKAIELFTTIPENVTFLEAGEDRKYHGYLCSSHGHRGINGSRGSLSQLEKTYIKIIMGHVHRLEQLREGISVGTSTNIPLPYQLGNPSTSMAGNAVVYEGGLAQAIPIVKGKWARSDILKFLKTH